MSTRAAYAKACDLAAEADEQGLPSEHLWATARELRQSGLSCECPRRADGSLGTPRHEHLDGCPDKGKRSGKSGKCGSAATARKRAKQATVAIEGGSAELAAAAKKAGYASGSAFVAAAIRHVEAGGKFSLG